ncbi:MAG: UDP-N-acetylglucosamine 4-epimerase [Chlamydiales bacterium]|nr:UDP-N-acetylglucosamine 4-epimerase [Chlamydiales bacterium]MCH9635084.1 UDP-N-acetylglucosamine 4-epimerase [Chlamydiales bacterium]MCH9703487.1 NAD-dependent epimerase/dehydratase family protein [Chlamydiota bacterium]
MKRVLVTGAAGFIGSHTALALKEAGHEVVGLDNFNDYYSVDLKRARAQRLEQNGISVIEGDLCDKGLLEELVSDCTHVLNLAAQAGVRYAKKNPNSYLKSNLEGFLNLLEVLKSRPEIKLVYASSSSVYGCNEKTPFSTEDRTDQPANLYAATKKANELMAYSYHHLFGLTTVGLRYFTVYGPWGRPDMAYFSFTEAILKGEPITLFNRGQMWRDFTYIDDVVTGTIAALDYDQNSVFNLGNHRCEELAYFVSILEQELGKGADIRLIDEAPGEMIRTWADISDAKKKLGYQPKTSLKEGLAQFIQWHKRYASGSASVMSEATTQ